MATFTVTIPDGLWPGDVMSVAVGAAEYVISVPDGVRGGDLIDVELPSGAPNQFDVPETPPTWSTPPSAFLRPEVMSECSALQPIS